MTTWAPVPPDQNTEPPVNVLRAPPATATSSVTGKPSRGAPPYASYLPWMPPMTYFAPVPSDQRIAPRWSETRAPPAVPISSVVGNPSAGGPPSRS